MDTRITPVNERKDARANRDRILVAAREEFAEHGMEAEMRVIADRAGVGVGTLYRHFESREHLLDAILAQVRDEVMEGMRLAIETEAPVEAFRLIMRSGAEAHERFGALMEVAMAEKKDLGGHERHEPVSGLFEQMLQRGKDDGVFRDDLDIPVLFAAVEAVFLSGRLFDMAADRGATATADAFADLFLRACAPSASP
jgi:AcrR family transcriptional regulator